jgi:hypothetical protein
MKKVWKHCVENERHYPKGTDAQIMYCSVLFIIVSKNLIRVTGTLFRGYSEIKNWQLFD